MAMNFKGALGIFVLTGILSFSGVKKPAADPGIRFMESSWSDVLEQARVSHKPVFIDTYTTWCGPCKLLSQHVFTNKAVAQFFNENFINVTIDLERGEGPMLQSRFDISAVPTLLIADADGDAVIFTKGYLNAAKLLEFGRYGLKKYQGQQGAP